jgi:acetylornithine deacetylase/succinyl-diaminopimelate desuccinylase-like protein
MELRDRVTGLMGRAYSELAELVAIKSVADAQQFPPKECARAAEWVRDRFAELGFVDLELAETADGSRAVVGSRPAADPGAPTVLLYAHYDVQPPLNEQAWRTPPFALTQRDGRWYGRGAADCKGNIVMHLTALRALGDDIPVNLKLVVEGSEEQGTGGLEDYVRRHADQLRADAILLCDTGNAAVGVPALTVSLRGLANAVVTVEALGSEVHSGMYGGPAPDALAALIAMLATLRDRAGNTTVRGLDDTRTWTGVSYPEDAFRSDATVPDGVSLLGDGSVADMLWARPAITVLGIDCPPVVGSAVAIQPRAAARLNLRIPPGTDPDAAQDALAAHLRAAAPWGVRVTVESEGTGAPFLAEQAGPAYAAMSAALEEAYGRPMTTLGQGGSIPLCTVFADTYPDAEIVLMGVEEPHALIHAPNESVDPTEIAAMALAEALFLQHYRKEQR